MFYKSGEPAPQERRRRPPERAAAEHGRRVALGPRRRQDAQRDGRRRLEARGVLRKLRQRPPQPLLARPLEGRGAEDQPEPLLADAPRHGYDIIRALEERSSGIYSPSPGVIYPTLTFLEEASYAVSSADGAKKVFSITEAGAAHLGENRDMVERALDHLERVGAKMAKAREWFGWDDDRERHGRDDRRNPELRLLRRRLRAALAEVIEAPADKQAEAASILKDAAEALEALVKR